jgi:hypothetical protein
MSTERKATPVSAPLTAAMRTALTEAARRSDRTVIGADRRTRGALYRRGLVDVYRGRATTRSGVV